MRFLGVHPARVGYALAVLFAACSIAIGTPADGERPPTSEEAAGQLRATLTDLDQWLAASAEGPRWRQYLQTEALRTELARGEQADARSVWRVLSQFAGDVPGLEFPEFYRTRRAVEQWLASLPPPSMDQLAQEIQGAKGAFLARTENDRFAAKAALQAQVERLDARLAADGAPAQAWRTFLLWDRMQAELARPSPDLHALDAVYARYAAGHDGLQMHWFADLRSALRCYLIVARTIGDKRWKARYPAILDDLAARVEKYHRQPTPDEASAINASLELLRDAGQPERLIRAVQANLSHPNLFVHASAWLVGAGVAEEVSQTAPVADTILGTSIYGTSQTSGQITTELVPSPNLGQVDVVFQGTVHSNNVGYRGRIQIYSNAVTQIRGTKRLLMDPQHAWTLPAVSSAVNASNIDGIQAGSRLAQRAAARRVPAQQGQADQIAAQHAELRVNQQIDERGEKDVAQLNARYAERIRDPLLLYNAFPRTANMSTTKEAIHVAALEGRWTELGAPCAPPAPDERWDLLAQIHETAVNNGANARYAGAIVEQEPFLASLQKTLGRIPERFQDEDKSQPWMITLAERDPLSVVFGDGLIRLTLRGEAYARGDNQYPGMNVTALYRPQSTPQGVKFVRQGALEIFPPGFVPGNGQRLSPRQQALRSLLERRFNRLFEPEIVPQPLVLSGNWKKAGELRMVEAKVRAGWLVLGWRPIPAAEKSAVAPAPTPAPPPAAKMPPPPPAKAPPVPTKPPAAAAKPAESSAKPAGLPAKPPVLPTKPPVATGAKPAP